MQNDHCCTQVLAISSGTVPTQNTPETTPQSANVIAVGGSLGSANPGPHMPERIMPPSAFSRTAAAGGSARRPDLPTGDHVRRRPGRRSHARTRDARRDRLDLGFSTPARPLLFSLRVRTRCGSCQFEFGVAVGVDVALSLFPLVEFLQLLLPSSFQFGSIG